MPAKLNVEFANFICHFGDKELLHYLHEIVVPAFFSRMKRTWGGSSYFIHEPSVEILKDRDGIKYPTISGRFVVDKTIRREQIYEDGVLVDSPAQMETAPTSFFVLSLRDHKLMFVKEMPGAPGLDAFRSTIQYLFNARRNLYIREVYEQLEESRKENPRLKKVSLKLLGESISGAHIQLISLSGPRSLAGFLKKMKTLKEIRLNVLKSNSEINNKPLFQDFEDLKAGVGAERATMVLANNEGMDKDYAAKYVLPALNGNLSVSLVGDDEDGKALRGNETDLKVSVPVDLPVRRRDCVKTLLKKFRMLVKEGLLTVAKSDETQKYVKELEQLQEI